MTRSARFAATCLLLSFTAAPLLATAATKPQTAQQTLMAKCSAQNKGKKGDEYKSAQKACLSGGQRTGGGQRLAATDEGLATRKPPRRNCRATPARPS